MFTGLWNVSVRTHTLLQERAPTNRLLNRLRSREGMRWGVPFMLLGVAYMGAAAGCAALVNAGWTEWLYLPFLLFFYNGLKFLIFGPWSLVLLWRARHRERRLRRQAARA